MKVCAPVVERIVSGGQTGVDQGALDAAMALGIEHGGWCPKGRLSERGRIDDRYRLRETKNCSYAERTEKNVIDSDGTLIVHFGTPGGGTALTKRLAEQQGKPCWCVDLQLGQVDLDEIRHWLRDHDIAVLNVAGPRGSSLPAGRQATIELLTALLGTADSTWSPSGS